MFPPNLILLTIGKSHAVKSLDRLASYSARFDEFDSIQAPKIWEAEDLSQGIYSRRRDLAGGRSGSIRALAVPSFGRWLMQEVD